MDKPLIENATNTVLYSATTMQYFEKHKIMEILGVSPFFNPNPTTKYCPSENLHRN